jgi:hypothetical protein
MLALSARARVGEHTNRPGGETNVIVGGRLWRRISDLGEIGKQGGGRVTRLSFTAEERVHHVDCKEMSDVT